MMKSARFRNLVRGASSLDNKFLQQQDFSISLLRTAHAQLLLATLGTCRSLTNTATARLYGDESPANALTWTCHYAVDDQQANAMWSVQDRHISCMMWVVPPVFAFVYLSVP